MLEKENDVIKPAPFSDRPTLVGFIVIAGIFLPLLTLIVELSTRFCAENLFDPIPTLWHIFAVATVPLANANLLWSIYNQRFERISFLSWISALSAGTAILYSLIFLPISPISIVAIIYVGLGFLPLSPMFSLWAVLLLRNNLLKSLNRKPFALTWLGLGTGFLLILSIIALSESRFLITRYGLGMAVSEDSQRKDDGIDFLRRYGNQDYLSQLGNSRRNRIYISDFLADLFGKSEGSIQDEAREIYYRLTGKTIETNASKGRFDFGDFDDDEQRFWGERQVSLSASQMDASIDNDASLGYVEWTFSLKNRNQMRAEEGFTQIQLPPNGVVSRVTLWINGEEREAAFGGRSQVTEAYEAVTAKKRDPVLVTTSGRDRVNLKCYPIQPNGGEMKMRIGITFPLILEDEKNGLIRLPYFRDKNFQVPESLKHEVWIESKRELRSENSNFILEQKENLYAVRGNLSDKEILDSSSSIRAVKSDEFKTVWAKNGEDFVTQFVLTNVADKPSRFIFVVDTSSSMKNEQEKIAATIRNLPSEIPISLVLTSGNALNRELAYPNSFDSSPLEIADKIQQATFDGGTDNLPALTKAWDLASASSNSAVIWIHSPQLYKFTSSNALAQRLIRRPNETVVYSVSSSYGFDEVEKELDKLNYLQAVPRFSNIQVDLERLISRLNQSKKSFEYSRKLVSKMDFTESKETSKHLVKLWANNEITRILENEPNQENALKLAVENQLVTPVSGAVVLETQQQYDQFGLKPVDKNSVPTIPEPETYFLIAVMFGILIWLFATRKLF